MLSKLLDRFFKKDDLPEMTQVQKEAFVDALTFAIMADGEFVEQEREELTRAVGEMSWSGEISRESYTTDAINRVDDAKKTAASARAYCETIAERLSTNTLKEETYAIAARLVCADGEVVDSERGLMTLFIQTFELDRERALELAARAHREYDLL